MKRNLIFALIASATISIGAGQPAKATSVVEVCRHLGEGAAQVERAKDAGVSESDIVRRIQTLSGGDTRTKQDSIRIVHEIYTRQLGTADQVSTIYRSACMQKSMAAARPFTLKEQ